MPDLLMKKDDLKFGFDNENKLLESVNHKYPDTVKRKEKYSHFDFRNDRLKIDFELKSRRIHKGKFSTIFFAECKLLDGRDRMRRGLTDQVIYVFNFEEKTTKNRDVWYWIDDGSDLEITMCGNFARGEEAKRLANVPIERLLRF
tara:strand:- start:6539 stop:6973 length:435 start_codon:yes stop_codon:yes gene_type:complete